MRLKSVLILLAAAFLVLAGGGSRLEAQAPYPSSHTITMVVPFPAGGPTDIIARILASALQQSLGQNVIIDNRVGAGGNLGIAYVARANPDGYTLLFTSIPHVINPHLYRKVTYDALKDFTPVIQFVSVPLMKAAGPSLPAKTVKEVIALAKAKPGALNSGSGGSERGGS